MKRVEKHLKEYSDTAAILQGETMFTYANMIGFAESYAKEQGKWISVEERLPEAGKKVIIYIQDKGLVTFGWLERINPVSSDLSWARIGHMGQNVTKWQPLPEPPNTNTEG
jgi:hypothetical protein